MRIFLDLEPNKQRNLLTLFITGLLFWFSITSLLPVLPLYVRDLGGTKQQIGLVMGCFAIGLLLSRTWLGQLADSKGRKITILIGTAVVGMAPLGYLCANSVYLLMILRMFHGISISGFTTGYSALVVDISPPKQRGELIGYMSLAIPIGMAIGPALGGYLQANLGYTPLFLIAAIAGLIAFVCASRVQEELNLIQNDRQQLNLELSRSFGQLIKTASFIVPGVVMLLIGLVFGTLSTFLPLYIQESNLDFNAGLFYGVAAIASFLARVVVGKASDLWGRGLFITFSLICYTVSMFFLADARTTFIFILSAFIEGTGAGILIPMLIALMSDRCHLTERGKVYAICIGGFDLGIAMAGPILGSIALMINYSTMFRLAGILAAIALFIFLTKSSKNLGHSWRFALGRESDFYAVK